MPDEVVAILSALAAAFFIAVGIVVRQRSTMHVSHEDSMGTGMATALVCQPLWWAGTTSAIGGYAFQALALGHGSLLLVQPVLVTSLLFALPVAARLAHRRVTRSEWRWAVVLTLAIALFVLLGNPGPGRQRPLLFVWGVAGVVSLLVVGVCVWIAHRSVGRRRALTLAIAVAVLFALVAVLTKLSVVLLERGGLELLLSRPPLYVLVVIALGATLLQQSAFHAGALQTSVPTMIVLEPVVAVVLGLLVLGEKLHAGGPASVALGLTVVVMVVATTALARDAALHDVELLEPEPERVSR